MSDGPRDGDKLFGLPHSDEPASALGERLRALADEADNVVRLSPALAALTIEDLLSAARHARGKADLYRRRLAMDGKARANEAAYNRWLERAKRFEAVLAQREGDKPSEG